MSNKICRILLVIFAYFMVMAIARLQEPVDSCAPNAEFTMCGVSCPAKCSDDPLLIKMCTSNCVVGCQCISGYVLNDDDICVLRSEC